MRISSQFRSIERRFSWSFAGFVLGTVSLVFALTLFYLGRRESQTDLRIAVEDEVDLVEIREQIPRLRISYDEEDVLQSKKQMKLLRISVENSGKSILQGHYDLNRDFVVKFLRGLQEKCGSSIA